MPTVELQFSSLPVHVRTARLVAAALGRRLGLDAVTIDEVKLAVGEACSRAVGVNLTAGAAAPIVVQFQDDDDILEIRVLDCGPSDDLAAAVNGSGDASGAAPEWDESVDAVGLTSRLGLAVIAGLVDDMSVAPRNVEAQTGSVITMRWPIVTF